MRNLVKELYKLFLCMFLNDDFCHSFSSLHMVGMMHVVYIGSTGSLKDFVKRLIGMSLESVL